MAHYNLVRIGGRGGHDGHGSFRKGHVVEEEDMVDVEDNFPMGRSGDSFPKDHLGVPIRCRYRCRVRGYGLVRCS